MNKNSLAFYAQVINQTKLNLLHTFQSTVIFITLNHDVLCIAIFLLLFCFPGFEVFNSNLLMSFSENLE